MSHELTLNQKIHNTMVMIYKTKNTLDNSVDMELNKVYKKDLRELRAKLKVLNFQSYALVGAF